MKNKIDIKPIAFFLIVVGFLFFIILNFPLFKVTSDAMSTSFEKEQIVLVNSFAEIKLNDVVVFEKNDEVVISRVVAVSGDEISCEDGVFLVNGIAESKAELLFEYDIYTKSDVNDSVLSGFEEFYPKREYRAHLTFYQADSLRIRAGIKKVKQLIHSKDGVPIFSNDSTFIGSRDNFGPYKLPIEQKYYWVMNDNRHRVKDSRFFGFISEDEIIGKVVHTFYGF